MASRVFLDANVLVEILLGREKQFKALKVIQDNFGRVYISALTGHLALYFSGQQVSHSQIKTFLQDFTMLPLDAHSFDWAFTNTRNSDIEDALQLAVAIRNGCDEFITLDKKLVDTYKGLPVIDVKLLA